MLTIYITELISPLTLVCFLWELGNDTNYYYELR